MRDLGFDVTARGRIDLKTRRFRLEKAAVTWNGATAEIDGEAEAQPAGLGPSLAAAPAAADGSADRPDRSGWSSAGAPTRGWRSVTLYLAVPPIACQGVLDSLPDGIVSLHS